MNFEHSLFDNWTLEIFAFIALIHLYKHLINYERHNFVVAMTSIGGLSKLFQFINNACEHLKQIKYLKS